MVEGFPLTPTPTHANQIKAHPQVKKLSMVLKKEIGNVSSRMVPLKTYQGIHFKEVSCKEYFGKDQIKFNIVKNHSQ